VDRDGVAATSSQCKSICERLGSCASSFASDRWGFLAAGNNSVSDAVS